MATAKVDTVSESKGKPLCFLCNKLGHRASDCWTKSRAPKSTSCWICKKSGHRPDSCPSNSGKRTEASCSVLGYQKAQHEKSMEDAPDNQDEKHCHDMCDGTQSNATCDNGSKQMPTVKGYLEGKLVTVLRDTGCNTVVVKRSLVPDCNLTGNTRTIRLLDRSAKVLPEAEVYIDSQFFRGRVLAVCMENPLYEVVLGNIAGVLSAAQPAPKQPAGRPKLAQIHRDPVCTEEEPEDATS
uniref:Putative tick transposon n=1 Tax=Rhipicephalus microplus TaxID=6941 RepID=A0A6G4ZZ09_RHIMP